MSLAKLFMLWIRWFQIHQYLLNSRKIKQWADTFGYADVKPISFSPVLLRRFHNTLNLVQLKVVKISHQQVDFQSIDGTGGTSIFLNLFFRFLTVIKTPVPPTFEYSWKPYWSRSWKFFCCALCCCRGTFIHSF